MPPRGGWVRGAPHRRRRFSSPARLWRRQTRLRHSAAAGRSSLGRGLLVPIRSAGTLLRSRLCLTCWCTARSWPLLSYTEYCLFTAPSLSVESARMNGGLGGAGTTDVAETRTADQTTVGHVAGALENGVGSAAEDHRIVNKLAACRGPVRPCRRDDR